MTYPVPSHPTPAPHDAHPACWTVRVYGDGQGSMSRAVFIPAAALNLDALPALVVAGEARVYAMSAADRLRRREYNLRIGRTKRRAG